MGLLLVASILIILICFYNFYYKRLGLPPGPTPWPILGNLPQLAQKPPGTDVFFEWRDKYGPVFTYWMGEKPVVAFADYKTLDQTFNKDGENFSGHDFFPDFYLNLKSYTVQGISGMEGALFKEHRSFVVKSLRNLGLSKSSVQDKVLRQISNMFESLDEEVQAGATYHLLGGHIDFVIGNVANIFLFGHGFSKQHNDFIALRATVNRYMATVMTPAALLIMSHPRIFKHLPFFKGVYNQIDERIGDMLCYVDRQIQEHLVEIERNPETSDDYVSSFLREMEKREGRDGFTVSQLRGILVDLWLASQDATCSTLNWGIVYSIHNQEKQQKLQAELDRVVGCDRLVTMEDKASLPYASAYCL
uniref:Cytochrome P450 n=3 Tax=Bursaphelenchus xylophilus TaxID=6326 RepID=A0A1I7SH59_BURXY